MRRHISLFSLTVLSLLLSGCIVSNVSRHCEPTTQGAVLIGGKLYTSAWIQHSAEYKALCQQAYNIATDRVLEATRSPLAPGAKPWVVVTDIDETILDNTPNAVHLALRGKEFTSEAWNKWCELAEADTLMGALDFFCLAQDRGVEIFYVSNRDPESRAATLANLQKFGFPQADEEHLLLREKTSDKSARREKILSKYNILLFLGDNLGDFDHIFDSLNAKDRKEAVQKFKSEFGKKFIVLPNPNYGTWERVLLHEAPSNAEKEHLLMHQQHLLMHQEHLLIHSLHSQSGE